MGKFRKKRSNGNDKPRETKNTEGWDKRESNNYDNVIKENELFDKYYKAQSLLSPEEYEKMVEYFKLALPTTFRLTGTRKQALELLDTIENKFIPELTNLEYEGQLLEGPKEISFYPNKFGWKFDIGKNIIKKESHFKQFHQFLVSESEIGNISRQEEVSMIPPLLLQVEPEHFVLDMCAAPGSKTAQLIEALHKDETMPKGMIIANDSNEKRCYTLLHQIKRLKSANFVVTNHEAQFFPTMEINDKRLLFDRILCDVPCSGDGTLRKNYMIWKDWNLNSGYSLHHLQTTIAERGIQLLKVGGRLVYSTCSINPVENEAVVAALLNKFKGQIKLLDVQNLLPELKRAPGIKDWKILDKNMEIIPNFEAMDPKDSNKKWAVPTMFPPSNVNELGLEKCLRIYPHLQNTGGFFVAVFEKVLPTSNNEQKEKKLNEIESQVEVEKKEAEKEIENENNNEDNTENSNKVENNDGVKNEVTNKRGSEIKQRRDNKKRNIVHEEPFIFMEKESSELANIKKYFHLSNFPDNLFIKRSETDRNKTITLVSPSVREFLLSKDINRVKLVNLGIKAFSRVSDKYESNFRLQSESIDLLLPYINPKLIIDINCKDLLVLLQNENPLNNQLSTTANNQLENIKEPCSLIARYTKENDKFDESEQDVPKMIFSFKGIDSICFPLWKAQVSVNLTLPKQDISSIKSRFFG